MDFSTRAGVVLRKLEEAGFEAYIVGGAVRDALRGTLSEDEDIATSALPEETIKVFHDFSVIPTGLDYGTVTVMIEHQAVEVTTFRADSEYLDGRRPKEVKFSQTLREDLARRDFTINAMAWNPRTGLIDPFCGKEDLEKKLLRTVGDPTTRFGEDGLRIMRALRFASTLDFELEKQTEKALFESAYMLDKVAAERLAAELQKLVCGKAAGKVMVGYPEILDLVTPGLLSLRGLVMNNPAHAYDVLTHTAVAVESSPNDLVTRLVLYLHDFGKPYCYSEDSKGHGHFWGHPEISAKRAETILRELKFPKKIIEQVTKLILYHGFVFPHHEQDLIRLTAEYGPEQMRELLIIRFYDVAALRPNMQAACMGVRSKANELQKLIESGACLSLKDLAITGSDLIKEGITEGKMIGKKLDELLTLVLKGDLINDHEELLAKVREERK